jgi:hypothetical protein
VDRTLKRLDDYKAKNDERLQKVFKEVAAAAPDMEKLPASQKALAKRMDEAKEALNKARADYNAKLDEANAKTDQVVKQWTEQLATQQARIEDRRRQLEQQAKAAIVASQNASEEQQAKVARLQKLRDALVLALKSEQAALKDYHDAYGRFTEAQTRQQMAAGAANPQEELKRADELRAQHDEADRRAQELDKKARTAAELVPPTYNDVQTVSSPDRRLPALAGIGAVAGIGCLLTLLMTRGEPGSSSYPSSQDADGAPADGFGLPADELGATEHDDALHDDDDDDHAGGAAPTEEGEGAVAI